MTRVAATCEADVIEAVTDAVAARRTLAIVGHGSRGDLGRDVVADAVLDVGGLDGVVVYEPAELVLTVRPGTPLAGIKALLASEGQYLAFEPPDFGPLWGRALGLGSVGGAVSVGLGGPRRIRAGGPRDHLLGFRAVNGFGEAFAGGGRVVKNVTGFDLPKLMAGAFGTLGVLTEITLKVLPAPRASATVIILGLGDVDGLRVLRRMMAGPLPVSAAAHIPADVTARMPALAAVAGQAATLLRLEAPGPVVTVSAERLLRLAGPDAAATLLLEGTDCPVLWRQIGGAEAFAGSATPVWRLSAPPAQAAALGDALRRQGMLSVYYDWAGGLLWVEAPPGPDGGALIIRDTLRLVAQDGHATLVRGSAALRAAVPPLQPLNPGVQMISRRMKAQFDPHGVFNPGRMGDL